LVFQETFKELMTKKEEATAEREEWQRRDKEATTKSFVDLQERSVAADEAIAKARLLEAEAKTKGPGSRGQGKALGGRGEEQALGDRGMTKLLEAQAMLMAEETKIMLTDLETISDPARWEWLENRQKTIQECQV
jgi:hypothetical protein